MDVAYAVSAVLAVGVIHNAIDKRSYSKMCGPPKPPVELKKKYVNSRWLTGISKDQVKSIDQVENTLTNDEKFQVTLRGGQQFFLIGREQVAEWFSC